MITFGEVAGGQRFGSTRGTFRRLEEDVPHPGGFMLNAVWEDGPSKGRPCYFTADSQVKLLNEGHEDMTDETTETDWLEMDELADHFDTTKTQIAMHAREESPLEVDGELWAIERKSRPKAASVFRGVFVGCVDESDEEEADEAPEEEADEVEPGSIHELNETVHGRTVNAIAEEFDTLQGLFEHLAGRTRTEALDVLVAIDGVGAKGAEDTIAHLEAVFGEVVVPPTPEEVLSDETVKSLRAMCAERDLKQGGTKEELIARIVEWTEAEADEDDESERCKNTIDLEKTITDAEEAARAAYIEGGKSSAAFARAYAELGDDAKTAFKKWRADYDEGAEAREEAEGVEATDPSTWTLARALEVRREQGVAAVDVAQLSPDVAKEYKEHLAEQTKVKAAAKASKKKTAGTFRIDCPYCAEPFDEGEVVDPFPYETGLHACADPDDNGWGNCGLQFWLRVDGPNVETVKLEDVDPDEINGAPDNIAEVTHAIERNGDVKMVKREAAKKSTCPTCGGGGCPECAFMGVVEVAPEPEEEAPDNVVSLRAKSPPRWAKRLDFPDAEFIGVFEHDSPEWHEARAQGVGSSDVGAILGHSSFKTIVDLWHTKLGHEVEEEPWLESYRQFGQWFEPIIMDHIEDTAGVEIVRGDDFGALRSTIEPFMFANCDGYNVTDEAIEEVKTGETKWDEVPEEYYAQVQEQMFVTGRDRARVRLFVCPIRRRHIFAIADMVRSRDEFVDWLLENGELHTFEIERDDDYIAHMIERCREFMGYVEREEEPPTFEPDGTIDLEELAEENPSWTQTLKVARAAFDNFALLKPRADEADTAKKTLKTIFDRAAGFMDEPPKRFQVGPHKATKTRNKYGTTYWTLYPADVELDL